MAQESSEEGWRERMATCVSARNDLHLFYALPRREAFREWWIGLPRTRERTAFGRFSAAAPRDGPA